MKLYFHVKNLLVNKRILTATHTVIHAMKTNTLQLYIHLIINFLIDIYSKYTKSEAKNHKLQVLFTEYHRLF